MLILTNDTQVFEGISKNSIISLNFNHWTNRITEIRLWSSKNNLTSVIGVDEESVMIAAEISKELGIVHNSIESVKKTRNKFLLRTCLKNNNLPSPWFNRFAIKEDPKKLIGDVFVARAFKPLQIILQLIHSKAENWKKIFIFLGKTGKNELLQASKSWDIEYKQRVSVTSNDSIVIEINRLKKK